MNATKYVTTKDITIPAGTILGEAPPKTVRAVPFVSALIPHGVDATSEWVMPMDEAMEYGLIVEFSQESAMSDENVGGFEEWFAAQWGIGGHRQIALSAWNAALSAHGENASVQTPVVDEAMVMRAWKAYVTDDSRRGSDRMRAALTAALKGADHE